MGLCDLLRVPMEDSRSHACESGGAERSWGQKKGGHPLGRPPSKLNDGRACLPCNFSLARPVVLVNSGSPDFERMELWGNGGCAVEIQRLGVIETEDYRRSPPRRTRCARVRSRPRWAQRCGRKRGDFKCRTSKGIRTLSQIEVGTTNIVPIMEDGQSGQVLLLQFH